MKGMNMKRDKVEEFIGKQVVVKLFDETTVVGELHKTGEEQFKGDSNLYIPSNYYFLINPQSCLFRSSHITKMNITYMSGLKR